MAGSHPGLRIHENRAVNADVPGTLLNKFLPPGLLYVVLEFHAKIAVIPGVGQSAVDLGSRIDKAPVLGKRDNLIHRFFHVPVLTPFY